MGRLCRLSGAVSSDAVPTELAVVDRLFGVNSRFADINEAFGSGAATRTRVVEGVPESLRVSVEHRYELSPWPMLDFVILESKDGLAWGYTFERHTGIATPLIDNVDKLSRWSHVETEVRAALGLPLSGEAWPPWSSAVYRDGSAAISLCYVFGLLQSVQYLDTHDSN